MHLYTTSHRGWLGEHKSKMRAQEAPTVAEFSVPQDFIRNMWRGVRAVLGWHWMALGCRVHQGPITLTTPGTWMANSWCWVAGSQNFKKSGETNKKPTFWGWFPRPIYGILGGWFILEFAIRLNLVAPILHSILILQIIVPSKRQGTISQTSSKPKFIQLKKQNKEKPMVFLHVFTHQFKWAKPVLSLPIIQVQGFPLGFLPSCRGEHGHAMRRGSFHPESSCSMPGRETQAEVGFSPKNIVSHIATT